MSARDAGAALGVFVQAEPHRLAARACALTEAAGWFPVRDRDLALALGAEPDMAWLPEWTLNIVLDLGRVGLGELAAQVGAALARVDVANASVYAADIGVALPRPALPKQPGAKIADNLATWPEDFWVRVHAGDALVELDDAAEALFAAAAAEMADDTDDLRPSSTRATGSPTFAGAAARRTTPPAAATPTARTRPVDPCPWGSGSKFKHCHGQTR